MTDLSYQMIRSANQAREAEDQRAESRKRNLLLLVNHYLNEEGYIETATALSKETNLDFSKFEVCDNVDLITVLLEYESYHFVKFQRYPKISKPVTASKLVRSKSRKTEAEGQQLTPAAAGNGLLPAPAAQSAFEDENAGLSGLVIRGQTDPASPGVKQKRRAGQIIDFRGMINAETRLTVEEGQSGQQFHDPADRLLKPLGSFLGYNQEWRDLASTISRDIFLHNPNVRWQDIIGLESAKRLVKEAVVYPIKYPQLFTGILSPWKGLLLYGPPGTGKTLLAKAVATECNTTFFNISASSIVSKWRGDSEKLVRVLFEMARFHAPSTIFLDELDSLMSQRAGAGGGGGEHEGSRRMKTELLVQMDGLAKTDELVFLLAASNLPWELDHAMLRRLEKRILVDLPNHEARQKMMEQHLPPISRQPDGGLELRCDVDYERAAALTEGYSGSDITLVCKEAAMRVVRKIFDALENHTE
uniref:Katanin p60 ATPase-containing subunit A-like 2 n=1 Tax=Macrostomum lignano TaxID=282301 RepID=A0A1I8GHE0_9PLAT